MIHVHAEVGKNTKNAVENKMRIGVDIDNVLANYDEALMADYLIHDKLMGNKGIVNKNVFIRNMFSWSGEHEKEYYKNNIERLAINFKPLEDCSKYIKLLRKKGNQICIVSGRDNGEYSDPYQMTVDWLKKHDIEYDELILTNAYKPQQKADICLQQQIDIMIDDNFGVCEKCAEYSIKSLLFDTDFNRKETRFKRVNSWKEVYKHFD